MMHRTWRYVVVCCLMAWSLVPWCQAAQYKVLVVMSYEEDYLWDKEIKEGIDAVLASSSDIKYFYMDTKKNPDGGPAKATEALALFQQFQPDGVITADDNAQKCSSWNT